MTRWPQPVTGFFLLLCAAALTGQSANAAAPPPPAVIVEIVAEETIADRIEGLGTLRPNETVRITANVSDTISRIHFEDGQTVAAGDVLVEMTDAEEAALLTEAETLADEARRQYERHEELVVSGSASQSLLDERRRESRAAEARLEAVRSRLRDRLIVAPFSGRVGLRLVSPGALVSPGEAITTLVDDSRMKLDFSVPAIYFTSVRPGTRIEATTPVLPDRIFLGVVTSIESTIDPVTRAMTVRAVIDNEAHELIGGMLMTLNLLRNERQALVVSEEAIIPQGETKHVFVVVDTGESLLVEKRMVELGARMPGRVEVVSGLSAGEKIVTHGTLKIRPGMPVRIRAVDDGSRPLEELIRPEQTARQSDADSVPAA